MDATVGAACAAAPVDYLALARKRMARKLSSSSSHRTLHRSYSDDSSAGASCTTTLSYGGPVASTASTFEASLLALGSSGQMGSEKSSKMLEILSCDPAIDNSESLVPVTICQLRAARVSQTKRLGTCG